MKLAEFQIGQEFTMSDHRWRCTDIGSRVVVAIRLSGPHEIGGSKPRILTREEAEAIGMFNGPTYIVHETAIDEDSMKACFSDGVPENTR